MNISSYFPIWDKLNKNEQQALTSSALERHFHKGDLIHTGGDCMGLILVTSGQLRAYTVSEEGREITMYRLFERDICLFSASCMMRSIQFDLTISAEKDTNAILIPSEAYRKIMENSAPLANYTNEIMSSRFSDVMWLIDQIMWKSFDHRLADFLLNETNIEGTNILKITHEEIGNHMGNPREVVTRMLKYFANEGLVKLSRGTIEIIDQDKLLQMSINY
ncbi:MAG: Crp/Fnr family transcriptional regulator [Eubacteriales bacterium]|nr:Crp/Fnr family transcriptional regulator [Eubacteriales bacterium]